MEDNNNTSKLEIGRVIQDTYEVIERLGEGGMGATYKARHVALHHLVCIKVISEAYSRDPKALDLFKREANLLREVGLIIGSDAIVKIETLLRDSSGSYFLIMEFIDGKSLSHYINLGARLRDDDLISLAKRLLQGLAAIHSKNIVHRDISPDNIMVPQNNILQAKIVDFGLASDVAGTEKSILGDSFAGKISYASPEQLGLFGGKISAQSDLYSLGLVLLAVAGLSLPARGSMLEAIDSRRVDIRISDPRLSPETTAKLEALLRANPEERADLFTRDLPAPPPAASVAMPLEKGAKKSLQPRQKMARKSIGPVAAIGLGVGVIGLFGVALYFITAQPSNNSIAERTVANTVPTAPKPAQPPTLSQKSPEPEIIASPEVIAASQSKITTQAELDTKVPSTPEPSAQVKTNPPETEPPAPPQLPIDDISIAAAEALIADGSDAAIIAAARILAEIAEDQAQPMRDRAMAFALTGWVYDSYYRSGFIPEINAPDVTTALSAYEAARDLGLFAVQPEINRLSSGIRN